MTSSRIACRDFGEGRINPSHGERWRGGDPGISVASLPIVMVLKEILSTHALPV
ncbi:hypothetical protein BURMUCGD1_5442 [Burkholderia multivorans CGD1]|nr:hypothetical protein BURMUCGD1_5442 [Burkholderia multivorans CGD1]